MRLPSNAPTHRLAEHRARRAFLAVRLRFPYPPYLREVIGRSVALWVAVRIMYVVVLLVGAASMARGEALGFALNPAWPTRMLLVALVASLVWWDRRRSHELLLPANLGTAPAWFVVASLATGAVLDVSVQHVLAAP